MTDPYRKIIHIDMDAFFASVEQRDNPELRGKPVAVGHAEGRGVVATASYEARRFGVHSAMPSRRALELCPDLIFVPGRMDRDREVSAQVTEIFSRYTDLIEPLSIDEAFLDVTENKKGIALGVDGARQIKAAIREELHLVASAGVSYNKFLAKIASDWRKPDGLCTIHPDKALEFIDQLKVEHLWGVGPATAKRMHEMGFVWARQLRELSLPEMMRRFGRSGYTYYRFVRGIDDRPVAKKPTRGMFATGRCSGSCLNRSPTSSSAVSRKKPSGAQRSRSRFDSATLQRSRGRVPGICLLPAFRTSCFAPGICLSRTRDIPEAFGCSGWR